MKKAIKILALIMAILLLGLALFSCSEEKESDKDDESSKKTVPLSDPDEAAKALKSNGYTVESESRGAGVFIRAYNGDDNHITIVYCKDKSTASDLYDEAKEYLEVLKKDNASDYENFSVGCDGTIVWKGTKDALKAASKINKNTSSNDNSFNDNKFSSEIEDSTESAIKETLNTESSTSSAFISDPDKVVNAFKANGYSATKTYDDPDENVIVSVQAYYTTDDSFEMISIAYYKDVASASKGAKDASEYLTELQEAIISSGLSTELELNRLDTVVWIGTPNATKIALNIN